MIRGPQEVSGGFEGMASDCWAGTHGRAACVQMPEPFLCGWRTGPRARSAHSQRAGRAGSRSASWSRAWSRSSRSGPRRPSCTAQAAPLPAGRCLRTVGASWRGADRACLGAVRAFSGRLRGFTVGPMIMDVGRERERERDRDIGTSQCVAQTRSGS